MEAYTGFAKVYDTFMDNIPYDEWSEYLISLLKEYHITEGLVLDMGCGTGKITERLAGAGYEMIGIDNAEEMLEIASTKAAEKSLDILYLQQDMRELELFGTVRAVVCICDSVNYILSEEELQTVFRLVNNYLDEEGIFIFDFNTKYKYETILAQNTFAENREDCSFIWDNYYDLETRINEYSLTIYVKDEDKGEDACFTRFDEEHYQRAYELKDIKNCLQQAGMEFSAAYDAFTHKPPQADSERVYVIAKERRQLGKLYYSDK